jgi:hypothetical protein
MVTLVLNLASKEDYGEDAKYGDRSQQWAEPFVLVKAL